MNNRLQRKFAICCLFLMFITPFSQCYAATIDECGQALADYAVSFVDATTAKHTNLTTHYYCGSDEGTVAASEEKGTERVYAWNNQQSPTCTHNIYGDEVTDLGMDCVGWVSYAIHQCYGLGGNDFTIFVSPSGCNDPFEIKDNVRKNDYKVGDILISDTHVMIYIGNDQIVDCANSNGGHPGVAIRSVPNNIKALGRITEKGAAKITTLQKNYNGTKTSSGVSYNFSEFFFNGVPDGKYSISTKDNLLVRFLKKIVNAIQEIFLYCVGILVYLIRGVIVGLISMFDRLLNNTVKSIEDSPVTLMDSGVTVVSADDPDKMDRSVTIEGLVFNDLDLFDINIFKD